MANAHSHAFHRALRSRTHTGGGSFWTWREVMYRAPTHLDPERYHRLARAVFAEMALAGVTCVGEFHYLHHRPDGTPYAAANAMGARAAGRRHRGRRADHPPRHAVPPRRLRPDGYRDVDGPQRAFSDGSAEAWAARLDGLATTGPGQHIGVAIHSVRAVDPVSMALAAAWAATRDTVLHVHVSEQPAENDACLAHHDMTPLELLASVGALGSRTCVVHGTHLGISDVAALASTATTVCLCPTTERDLGDGIGPSAELAATQLPMSLGQRLACGDRPVRGGPGRRAGRAVAHRPARCAPDRRPVADGHRRRPPLPRLGRRRHDRRGRACRPGDDPPRFGAHRGSPPTLETVVFAATAADVTNVVVDGRTVVRDGAHVSIDVAAELQATITHCSRRPMTAVVVDRIGSLITNDPALGRGPLGIVDDAAVVIVDGVVTAIGPAGTFAPTSGSTPRVHACCLASSTATPTWCSPATAPPSSPRGWRAAL